MRPQCPAFTLLSQPIRPPARFARMQKLRSSPKPPTGMNGIIPNCSVTFLASSVVIRQQPKPQAQPTGLNGLLGTLMTANQPVQQQASSFDGSDLLNILAQMMLKQ